MVRKNTTKLHVIVSQLPGINQHLKGCKFLDLGPKIPLHVKSKLSKRSSYALQIYGVNVPTGILELVT